MSAAPAKIPQNIFYFEVLLYLSLAIDALSMPFRDDSFENLPDMSAPVAKLVTAALILLFIYLVWLAARRRKNWARMILMVSLALSAVSIVGTVSDNGIQIETVIDVVSAALTAFGLYLSFTGDAVGWFAPWNAQT
ncbi:MAG: hypothetical protein J0I29_08600 [Rhizobiales bacterium]|nr:hypothetical protein [Hyphomicrobiales bacterium]